MKWMDQNGMPRATNDEFRKDTPYCPAPRTVHPVPSRTTPPRPTVAQTTPKRVPMPA